MGETRYTHGSVRAEVRLTNKEWNILRLLVAYAILSRVKATNPHPLTMLCCSTT